MADSELRKVGIPRNNPYNSHQYGRIRWRPGDMTVDGTAPAAFTNDVGTDGTQQDEELEFATDADDLAFGQDALPNDWGGSDVRLRLTWSCTSTSGTVLWAGTIRSTPGDDTAVSNIAGEAFLGTATTVSATTLNIVQSTIDLSSNAEVIAAAPGDYLQLLIFRDVSGDNAGAGAFLKVVELIYSRK